MKDEVEVNKVNSHVNFNLDTVSRWGTSFNLRSLYPQYSYEKSLGAPKVSLGNEEDDNDNKDKDKDKDKKTKRQEQGQQQQQQQQHKDQEQLQSNRDRDIQCFWTVFTHTHGTCIDNVSFPSI
jgi:hypothetical protein